MFPIKTHKELEGLDNALENQNIGLARVHARRAIGEFFKEYSYAEIQPNMNAMEVLAMLSIDTSLPIEIHLSIKRLQGGLRAKLNNEVYSEKPREDALTVLQYFVLLLGHKKS